MKQTLSIVFAFALGSALLTGCDRDANRGAGTGATGSSQSGSASGSAGGSAGKPSEEKRKAPSGPAAPGGTGTK